MTTFSSNQANNGILHFPVNTFKFFSTNVTFTQNQNV